MKKLFAMILMLGVSLPALAAEVKLLCEAGNKKIVVTFDAEARTINGESVDTNREWHITDNDIRFTKVPYGHYLILYEISRLDGSFKWEDTDARSDRGHCAPAKQAF